MSSLFIKSMLGIIIGPTYIAIGSFIGMSSLFINSMLGIHTKIGLNCDIARTYFEGHDMIAHQNVILDSIIGKNVWFGGYSGTANGLLDRKNVRYQIGDRLVDTGTRSLRSSSWKQLCHCWFCNHFCQGDKFLQIPQFKQELSSARAKREIVVNEDTETTTSLQSTESLVTSSTRRLKLM